MSIVSKAFVLLSPEYEEEYERRYERQPKYIPTDYVANTDNITENQNEYSRIWMKNPKRKNAKS